MQRRNTLLFMVWLFGSLCLIGCESTSAEGDGTTQSASSEGSSEGESNTATAETSNDAATTDTAIETDTSASADATSVANPDAASGPEQEVTEEDVADAPIDDPFSFFVTSLEGMRELSGSNDGFGGNLGGLEGADDICEQLAAKVNAGYKTWRAFLSVTQGPDGGPIHAIDRIGDGPWFDRNGRLVAANKEDLLHDRPIGDPQVVDDLPNEIGQGQKQYGDNHDTLTGTNAEGQLYSDDPASTCQDWTSSVGPGSEKMVMGGHSWPRDDMGGPGGGGGGNPHGPPPWINACNGQAAGDVCKVRTNKKNFDSACSVHPDDASVLICLPPDMAEGDIPTPGGNGNTGEPWIEAHTVPGCAPGVQLEQVGGGEGTDTVGGAGGYGGIYCFALEP